MMNRDNFFYFDDDGLYLLDEAIQYFYDYIGMSFEEFSSFIKEYKNSSNVVSKEEILHRVQNYIINNIETYDSNFSRKVFIDGVVRDYDVLLKTLQILVQKAMEYYNLLMYLVSSSKMENPTDFQMEQVMRNLRMPHCGSVMKGSDINELLLVIDNTVKKMHKTIESLNHLSSSFEPYVDDFYYIYGIHRLYPHESIVLTDDNKMDDTSIRPNCRHRGYKPSGYYKKLHKKENCG